MRNFDNTDEIDRSCNNCGTSDWVVFEEDEYGGPKDRNIAKTWLYCNSCDREGKLFEESGNIEWTGQLR